MKKRTALITGLVAASVGGGAYLAAPHFLPQPAVSSQAAASVPLQAELDDQLATHRKLIVLYVDEGSLSAQDKELGSAVGQALFHDNLDKSQKLADAVSALLKTGNYASVDVMLGYIESAPGLYDADRLAFKELLVAMQASLQSAPTLAAVKLHKRVSDDLDTLGEVEKLYEKELAQVFGRFDSRGIALKRERWDDYVAFLKKQYTREQIIKASGLQLPAPAPAQSAPAPSAAPPETAAKPESPAATTKQAAPEKELFGKSLPPKTVVLTFDDGPHQKYTNEIAAILKEYRVPGVFFQVGKNIGAVDAAGKVRLGPNAAIDTKLLAGGYTLANHSYSHAQLNKQHDDALRAEIGNTDLLLKAVSEKRSTLFRFPYGARNKEGLDVLSSLGLKSVMWNIDSLDWADPVPTSIADRVLKEVAREKKGIVLFHDIHGKTVKALPMVLDRLVAEGYQFAGWNGQEFTVAKEQAAVVEKVAVTPDYQNSWAVVIGINDYQKWPKLQYAAHDADAIKTALTDKFGFAAEHVITLSNAEATRTNILSAFNTRLGGGKLGKNDRVFVFFAGHGSTQQLSSGRTLGYIIPVDADPNQTATDAIPMTDLQNIAENLNAKHVFFVMDACYSGLGLTRGANDRFTQENARRIGRQMLTAGGADQMVADGGPGGHSVFTWTLLQAMDGKADLNSDGIITATELAAYVAPAVSKISAQTPAFGSLPGSEGGEFVFEVPQQKEFLTESTAQLPADAIALSTKLQEAQPQKAAGAAPAPVVVTNLQGETQVIALAKTDAVSPKQRAEAANNRGLQLYREKQYALAESSFKEALKLRPDYAMAANNLGFVYFKEGKHQDAIEWFQNTLKLDPSRAVAYLNLGDAWLALNDREKAKKAFTTYLALAPKGASADYVRQQLGQ